MTLTFADALQNLPILTSAHVAAGKNGLGRIIRWTHIVDQPEVFSWVREGDLLVTTAFALKDNLDSELVMVEQMAQKGLAGMLVSIGRYINAVPDEMISAADAMDFPIVVIPWEIPLVEVTHAIHEHIIREQYQVTEQIYHIHDVLSQLVLEGGGLSQLAERLSELLQCSVTIEDDSFHLQAHASIEPEDEVRRRTIKEGATPSNILAYLSGTGLLDELKSDAHPQRVIPVPELGLTLDRMIAPVLVGQDLYGYIWIIAGQEPFDSTDLLAVERAAHIAALILSRERTVFAAEQRLKTSMVENLMDPSGAQTSYALQEIMHQFGLYGNCGVLLLEQQNASDTSRAALVRTAEQIMTDMNITGTALVWSNRLMVMLSSHNEGSAEELANTIMKRRGSKGNCLVAGISAPVSEASDIRMAYQQALQALQTGISLGKGNSGVWSYEQLGYLPWLQTIPADKRSKNPYHRIIDEMAQYDQKNDTNYLTTLETYLGNHLNHAQTARDLFVHRNSLLKRLNRIQDLWGLNFEDPYFVLNLHLAIVERRLG